MMMLLRCKFFVERCCHRSLCKSVASNHLSKKHVGRGWQPSCLKSWVCRPGQFVNHGDFVGFRIASCGAEARTVPAARDMICVGSSLANKRTFLNEIDCNFLLQNQLSTSEHLPPATHARSLKCCLGSCLELRSRRSAA